MSQKKLQARRNWQEVFKVMQSKDLQPRLLYPAKLSFRIEGQKKCFPDTVKLKELPNHYHQAIITYVKGIYLRKRSSKL